MQKLTNLWRSSTVRAGNASSVWLWTPQHWIFIKKKLLVLSLRVCKTMVVVVCQGDVADKATFLARLITSLFGYVIL